MCNKYNILMKSDSRIKNRICRHCSEFSLSVSTLFPGFEYFPLLPIDRIGPTARKINYHTIYVMFLRCALHLSSHSCSTFSACWAWGVIKHLFIYTDVMRIDRNLAPTTLFFIHSIKNNTA